MVLFGAVCHFLLSSSMRPVVAWSYGSEYGSNNNKVATGKAGAGNGGRREKVVSTVDNPLALAISWLLPDSDRERNRMP